MIIKEDFRYDDAVKVCGGNIQVFSDDGTKEMSHAKLGIRDSRFCGQYIKVMTWSGIGTDPEYRRKGCVRAMLEKTLPRGREFGTSISLLHPFSFSYYRKFGYERIYDTVQAMMPIKALDFVERYPDFVRYDDSMEADLIKLFDKFSENRNIMFRRVNAECFNRPNHKIYLDYNEKNEPIGYVVLEPQQHFDGINRMISEDLLVREMGYLNREALNHILGFLRMYEGELDTVKFFDITPTPELDIIFKHNMDTKYDIHPDIMARVLDTEAVLKQCSFPDQHGVFTLHIDDWIPDVKGNFRVEYQNGKCEVERLSDDACCEVILPQTAFARFLYGTDGYSPETAAYMDGVKINGKAPDFFRAFPKKINGLWEHF